MTTHSTGRCVFIAFQPGAASYLQPIWLRWLSRTAPEWHLTCDSSTLRFIRQRAAPVAQRAEVVPDTWPELSSRLDAWEPHLIIMSATASSFENLVVEYARNKGTMVFQIIDTWYNYRERFALKSTPCWPDRILVIDEIARDEAIAAGLPADLLTPVGHPPWELARSLTPRDPSQVLFADQQIEHHHGRRLGYTEDEAWAVVRNTAVRRPDLISQLFYCPHPSRRSEFADWPRQAEVVIDGEKALNFAGTVTGMFSSLLVEALLKGRQVISVQPGTVGTDMCSLVRHGMIDRVETVDQLVAALERPRKLDGAALSRRLQGSCDVLERLLLESLP